MTNENEMTTEVEETKPAEVPASIGEWIDATKELPPCKTRVLVVWEPTRGVPRIDSAYRTEKSKHERAGWMFGASLGALHYSLDVVTHWMPLPALPTK